MIHWSSCLSIVEGVCCSDNSSWKKNCSTDKCRTSKRMHVKVRECTLVVSDWLLLLTLFRFDIFVRFFRSIKFQWNFVKKLFQALLIVYWSQLVIKMTVSKVLSNDLWCVCANGDQMKPSKLYAHIVPKAQNYLSHRFPYCWGKNIVLLLHFNVMGANILPSSIIWLAINENVYLSFNKYMW